MQGRTYRYFKGTPLYPFGFGLSYTTFEYSNLIVDKTSDTQSTVEVSVDVKNTGKADGEEVVQIYVSNKTAKTIVPITALKGFKRVFLKQGEKKTITFTLKPEDFSVTNADAMQVVEAGIFDVAVDGAVPDKNSLVKSIEITGNAIEIK
jgi:beta-glucosidase